MTISGKFVWNVYCAVCWKKKKSTEIQRRYDGRFVCEDCNETRHPLDFYRPIPDQRALPFTQRDIETFISLPGPFACAGPRTQGRADIGTADCAQADKDNY